ncbi:SRPBCC family protein [Verrucomicrobiaceae bacterium 227]
MPKMHVSRSIRIDAPVDRVFAEVRSFESWPQWSPWLIADPKCSIKILKDRYSWLGEICGVGGMAVSEEKRNESIDYDLVFEKPFKSLAKVRMAFTEVDGGTEVTWTMDSKLPLFLFWMRKSMEVFIGMDYDRGLLMLKSLVEAGEVPSKLEFKGGEDFAGMNGVGLRRTCGFDEMAGQMGEDARRVCREFPGGPGFCVYYQWEPVKKSVTYLIGVTVDELPDSVPEGLEAITIPTGGVYVVKHTGPYRFLGNAWAAGMMHGRSKQFRHSKSFPPFEIYEEEDEKNPVVKICLPMK